ncbi:MAG: SDR family NAD(P)-dependent oxidoreductase [Alphaproteobacteria bacterium]|nr:SDR family NAD(P)-dependent oxidoreductase [Alphaproteobacteria bacterium]
MKDFKGKTAFITGGASGIGYAMAEAFGREGMNVMIADIDPKALEAAVGALKAKQVRAEGVVCDVTSRNSVREAALATIAKFQKVHVVCNNAGVGAGGPIGSVKEGDWDWVIDVNLKGVVYGTEVFEPLIASHGEGGHFVNTASMAGMISPAGMEPYNATKFAVVAMSEGWREQLAPKGIGVSVLCPGFVRTNIYDSQRAKQSRYGERAAAPGEDNLGKQLIQAGLDPAKLAQRVVEVIRDNELYIFTHPDLRSIVEMRFQKIMEGFDSAARSAAVKDVVSPNMTDGGAERLFEPRKD